VAVPVGTTVTALDGTAVCDLVVPGDRFLVAEGGRGGRGNARFLSNRRRAPAFAEQGERGEERWCDLELRLAADVALIGFPNVGKSTLISRISRARPKVADYPFTTLVPHLGVVRVGERPGRPGDATEFVVADVPGLIEGAADGKGLGHEFLRHVERARVLCVLLDLADAAPAAPAAQLDVLVRELTAHLAELADRPRLVVGSRCDVAADGVDTSPCELVVSAVRGDRLDDPSRGWPRSWPPRGPPRRTRRPSRPGCTGPRPSRSRCAGPRRAASRSSGAPRSGRSPSTT